MKINYTRLAIAIFCSFTVVTRVLGSQLEENNESRYLRRDRADKNEKVGSFGEDRFLFQGKGKGGKGKGGSKAPKKGKGKGKGSSKAPKGVKSSKGPGKGGKGKGGSKAPKSSKGPKSKGKGGKGKSGKKKSKKGSKYPKKSDKESSPTIPPSVIVPVPPTPVPTPAPIPTGDPVVPPTMAPTGPCPGLSPQARSDSIREILLTLTSEDVLADDKSPQSKAAKWLIEEDALIVCPDSGSQLIQRFALAAFYYSADGDKWKFCSAGKACEKESFLSASSECEWYGMECNANGKLNKIKLAPVDGEDIGLKGKIAPEIFFIPKLKDVEIEFSDDDDKKRGKLEGSIPDSIQNAEKLAAIDFQKQKLSGEIPEAFYNTISLREVDLDFNELTGTISDSISKLTNLVFFTASGNNFERQQLTSEIGKIAGLKYLGLNNANLVGERPDTLKDLTSMVLMDLSDNELSGDLSFLSGYTNLLSIALDNNEFTGPVPEQIWKSGIIETIVLENNQLTGGIPSDFDLNNLRTLRLKGNSMSGPFPSSITNLPKLKTLSLEGNSFTGTVTCNALTIITVGKDDDLDCVGDCCNEVK